jgi:hypothetical protein
MKVHELIEKLKEYPSDLRVIITGYEDGFNDITIIEEKEIAIDALTEWYYGQHVDATDEFRLEEIANPVIEKALLLDGKNLLSEK